MDSNTHAGRPKPFGQNEEQLHASDDLLVNWEGENDPLNPRNFSTTRKWFYLAVVAMGSTLVTTASSLYTGCYGQLMEEFGTSLIVLNLGLSLYVLGLGIGPLVFAPLSEFYGRRPIYITSIAFFLIWIIPCAVAQNIETLLVARFLNGASGSAFLAVAAGTVVDLFPPQELQIPMTIFTGAPFVGPALGPILSGFISSFADWRWTFYVLIIWTFAVLLGVLLVPETSQPILLSKKAAALRKLKGNEALYSASEKVASSKTVSQALVTAFIVPWQLFFLDPMIMAMSTYTALLQGILYLCFGAFPLVFGDNHNFNLWQIGLTFLGLVAGNFIACFFNPYWHKNWLRLISESKERCGPDYQPEPELRLPPAMVGSVLVTVPLLWFAWTTYSSVHWMVPIMATVFFSIGFFFVFQGIWTFKMAAYPKYAANAMAVNTATRCICSAAFPLFTDRTWIPMGFIFSCLPYVSDAAYPIYLLPIWQSLEEKE